MPFEFTQEDLCFFFVITGFKVGAWKTESDVFSDNSLVSPDEGTDSGYDNYPWNEATSWENLPKMPKMPSGGETFYSEDDTFEEGQRQAIYPGKSCQLKSSFQMRVYQRVLNFSVQSCTWCSKGVEPKNSCPN